MICLLVPQLKSRLTTVAKTNLKLLLSPEEKRFGGKSVFLGPCHTGRTYSIRDGDSQEKKEKQIYQIKIGSICSDGLLHTILPLGQ